MSHSLLVTDTFRSVISILQSCSAPDSVSLCLQVYYEYSYGNGMM